MLDPQVVRANDLKKIHLARRQMAWDDHTYRAILYRVTGHDSAAELNAAQRKAVIDEFVRLGWRIKTRKGHRQPTTAATTLALTGPGWGKDRLLSKIGALLVEAGRGWAYADGCARKMFDLESLRFCSPEQLHKIVAALLYDQKRRKRRNPEPPAAA